MKAYLSVVFAVMILSAPFCTTVLAQQEENKDAPKILTTDLTRRQKVTSARLDASFVIYDDDTVVEVVINGEKQKFVKGNTLTINKQLNFNRGVNKVVVTATDELGNKRTRNFLVAYGVELDTLPADVAKEAAKLDWKIVGNLQYNSDSNPNNDLGLPGGVDLGDITIEGQIPEDEQADTQTLLNLMAVLNYGKIRGYVGYSQSDYSKALYDALASKIVILGAGYAPNANERGLAARYLFLDINLGGEAFAQYNIFNVGYQFGRQDKEDGTTRHLFSLTYNHKIFSDSALSAGNTTLLNWEYTNLDADKLDYFKSLFAYGSGNDGSESSEFSVFSMDFDWSNKWKSGLLQGTGFGLHYKEYPNQEPLTSDLGDVRLDIPIRFSFHLGWAFNSNWSLRYNYLYKVNASTKSPYFKTVNGLQLKGAF